MDQMAEHPEPKSSATKGLKVNLAIGACRWVELISPTIVIHGKLLRRERTRGFWKWRPYLCTLQRHVLTLCDPNNKEKVHEYILLTSDWSIRTSSTKNRSDELLLVSTGKGSRNSKARKHTLRAIDAEACKSWAHAIMDTLNQVNNFWFQNLPIMDLEKGLNAVSNEKQSFRDSKNVQAV